jgi:hypothetical protein
MQRTTQPERKTADSKVVVGKVEGKGVSRNCGGEKNSKKDPSKTVLCKMIFCYKNKKFLGSWTPPIRSPKSLVISAFQGIFPMPDPIADFHNFKTNTAQIFQKPRPPFGRRGYFSDSGFFRILPLT